MEAPRISRAAFFVGGKMRSDNPKRIFPSLVLPIKETTG
jgi:hypothetical protein